MVAVAKYLQVQTLSIDTYVMKIAAANQTNQIISPEGREIFRILVHYYGAAIKDKDNFTLLTVYNRKVRQAHW